MRASTIQRALVLAAVAFLAAVAALAASNVRDRERRADLPVPVGPWYGALAAPQLNGVGRTTACGGRLTDDAVGVAHPVLPCGTKIFISYRDSEVLTHVIDRRAVLPGRQFDVTEALAKQLGLEGTQRIRWRYARRPERVG